MLPFPMRIPHDNGSASSLGSRKKGPFRNATKATVDAWPLACAFPALEARHLQERGVGVVTAAFGKYNDQA